jgi:hypothetical protein
MKSSMTQSDTQRDDYNPCKIPCPTTGGHMAYKNQIIII